MKDETIYCEWDYKYRDGSHAPCGDILTLKEIEFCKKTDKYGGKFYCYGHQKQFDNHNNR